MSTEQLEALRLADRLEGRYALHPEVQEAAAELRRLHALNAELLEALELVLKHEKWHAAIADEVTPQARAAIKQADAAIAKAKEQA